MNFSLVDTYKILNNTPFVILALTNNLGDEWTNQNEGENTWTLKEVLAHLIVCEETNWLVRAKIILSPEAPKNFVPIDMSAHFELAQKYSLSYLLQKFRELRENSLKEIRSYNLQNEDLEKIAMHPMLGIVNLQQLLSTWLTHDLSHIAQISRILAKQNKELVGPFALYLNILKS